MSTVLDVPAFATAPPAVSLPERYEIVNGEIQELPPMSFYATEVANRLKGQSIGFSRMRIVGDAGSSFSLRSRYRKIAVAIDSPTWCLSHMLVGQRTDRYLSRVTRSMSFRTSLPKSSVPATRPMN